MATIAALERYITPHLPGAARPFVQEMVRRTLDDFLTRTEVWKMTAPAVDWPTTGLVTMPAPATTGAIPSRFVKVLDVDSGCNVPFKTHSQLDEIDGQWITRAGTTPHYHTIGDQGPGQLRIYPVAETADAARLTVRAAFTISDDSTAYPDFIFSRFMSVIVNGVVGNILSIPGKDFTNLSLAGARLTAYETALPGIKSAGEAEFGTPDRTVQYGGL